MTFVVAIIISIIICTCLVNVERVLASGITLNPSSNVISEIRPGQNVYSNSVTVNPSQNVYSNSVTINPSQNVYSNSVTVDTSKEEGTTHYSNDYFEYDAQKSWNNRYILTKQNITDSKNEDLLYGEVFGQNLLDFHVYKNVDKIKYSDEVYNKCLSKIEEKSVLTKKKDEKITVNGVNGIKVVFNPNWDLDFEPYKCEYVFITDDYIYTVSTAVSEQDEKVYGEIEKTVKSIKFKSPKVQEGGTIHHSNDYFEYDAPESWFRSWILETTGDDYNDGLEDDELEGGLGSGIDYPLWIDTENLVYGEGDNTSEFWIDFYVEKNVNKIKYSDEVYKKYVSELEEIREDLTKNKDEKIIVNGVNGIKVLYNSELIHGIGEDYIIARCNYVFITDDYIYSIITGGENVAVGNEQGETIVNSIKFKSPKAQDSTQNKEQDNLATKPIPQTGVNDYGVIAIVGTILIIMGFVIFIKK